MPSTVRRSSRFEMVTSAPFIRPPAHRCARSAGGRMNGAEVTISNLELRRTVDGMCPAGDRHVRYRRNGGQRLPAEAERLQGREVLSRANLAGRIAFEGGRQLRRRDPTTVVRYLNEAVTAVADLDGYGSDVGEG